MNYPKGNIVGKSGEICDGLTKVKQCLPKAETTVAEGKTRKRGATTEGCIDDVAIGTHLTNEVREAMLVAASDGTTE